MSQELRISEPKDRAEVEARQLVIGIAPPNTNICVVVHPLEVNNYYCNKVNVAEDGTWEAIIAFGEPNKHHKKRYEFKAFGNPKIKFKHGEEISDFPEAEYSSQNKKSEQLLLLRWLIVAFVSCFG